MRGTTPSLDDGGDEVSTSDSLGKITFASIFVVMMGCVVVAGWMGKYPPNHVSEARRWLLAIGAVMVGSGCVGLLIVLFPVR